MCCKVVSVSIVPKLRTILNTSPDIIMNGSTFTSDGIKFFLILLLSCGSAFSQEKPIVCGTKSSDAPQEAMRLISELPAIMAKQNARTTAGETTICRISVDIDSDTYVKYERDTAAIIYKVIENIGKASKFFEREANIRIVVTSIRIFKDGGPDPYAGHSDIFNLLNILVNRNISDFNFDKRIYLYTKQVTGGFSGFAWIGGQYNVSPLESVGTIQHELAHNFGSLHTNSCNWPGGPLDYCGGVEGNCYDKSSETNTMGSMMSQCGGRRQPLHPMVAAVIKQHAETTFAKIQSIPQPVSLAGDITAVKGDFYAWPPSLSAQSYEFSYSTNVNFSGETIQPTLFNGVSLLKQTLGTDYFVRVRAINSFGTSDWSNTIKIRIDPDQPDVPLILSPATNSFFPSQQAVTLSFSNVPGATSYRIQVASLNDFDFAFPTDQIISGNTFDYSPYLGGYKWRVKAIKDGKIGKWSEIGYFSANPRLNLIGLFLPIPSNLANAPRTLPVAYSPSVYYSNTTITIADNPGFANPLFQRNYLPFSEIADVFKTLPANKELFLRVQERSIDLINYPDRDLVNFVVQFTTGDGNAPSGLTFLSEKNQQVFGRSNPKIAVSKDHIWLGVIDAGFIKLDQKTLTYQAFNRVNTDGLLGVGLENAVHTDDDLNIHVLNAGNQGVYRKVKLANEVPSSGASVTQISFWSYIQGYNPQNNVFWTHQVIFKETPSGWIALRQLSDSQYIKDIRFYNNKAWILLVNSTPVYNSEILVMDLNDHNQIYTINSTTSPAIANFIEQIEIQSDGKVWLRQTDINSNQHSIAHFNGSTWSVFNNGNAPFGSRITGLSLSQSGTPYILASGSETQVYKFNNINWIKVGDALPYQNFGGDLWTDKNESFWISNQFGLSRLASAAALPVTLVNFRAAPEGNAVALHWEVTDQVDMSKYVIEHSTDAKRFKAIGETPALDTAFYSLTHYNPVPGTNYYRLKSIETDADFAYSKVIVVNLSNVEDMVFYPNPVTNQLQLKVRPDLIGQSGRIEVFAADGKRIYGKEIGKFQGQEHIDVSNLAAGSYLIRIENKTEASSRMVQVVR